MSQSDRLIRHERCYRLAARPPHASPVYVYRRDRGSHRLARCAWRLARRLLALVVERVCATAGTAASGKADRP